MTDIIMAITMIGSFLLIILLIRILDGPHGASRADDGRPASRPSTRT